MHRRDARGDAPLSDARGMPLTARRAMSCHVFFFSPTCGDAAQTQADLHRTRPISADSSRIESYQSNIGVFRPEKGNRPVRKKKNLKLKIPVDLIRCYCRLHRLNTFLLLLLLFCFFIFLFLFFHSVAVLFRCRFRPKSKDFSGPYRSVTHCSSSSSSLLLRLLLHRP